jgi:hypothetical protein
MINRAESLRFNRTALLIKRGAAELRNLYVLPRLDSNQ